VVLDAHVPDVPTPVGDSPGDADAAAGADGPALDGPALDGPHVGPASTPHAPVVAGVGAPGNRRPGSRPTIKDIAALAGVSHSAASRALNGTGYVGARARQRVLAVADELGYVPHVTARYLKARVTRAVGVLVDDLRRPADAALAAGVLAAARERGLATMLADRVAGVEPERSGLVDFVAFGVAGVVVVAGPGGSAEHLSRYGIPTVEVAVGGSAEAATAAGRDAVERLAPTLEARPGTRAG
jgi:Bacterial regulatory proteins, lacI family